MNDLIPAATLILMRDRFGAPPEVLMLRRHAALVFAADAWVFPGGRVDEDDRAIAAAVGGADADDLAGRIAAIRETIEEVGLAVGLDPMPGGEALAEMRRGLGERQPFSALLAAAGCAIRPELLVPFARWAPPQGAPRRFDTRFYLAEVTDDVVLSVDGFEGVELGWGDAAGLLARGQAGEAKMLFPTRANLARVAPFDSFAATAAHAAAWPVRLVETLIEPCEGGFRLAIPDGHGYPPITMLIEARSRRY